MNTIHVSLLREKVNEVGDLEQFHLALLQLLVIVTGLQRGDDVTGKIRVFCINPFRNDSSDFAVGHILPQLCGTIGQITDDIVRLAGLQSDQFRNKISELLDLRRQRLDLDTRRLGSPRLC